MRSSVRAQALCQPPTSGPRLGRHRVLQVGLGQGRASLTVEFKRRKRCWGAVQCAISGHWERCSRSWRPGPGLLGNAVYVYTLPK